MIECLIMIIMDECFLCSVLILLRIYVLLICLFCFSVESKPQLMLTGPGAYPGTLFNPVPASDNRKRKTTFIFNHLLIKMGLFMLRNCCISHSLNF